MFQNHDETCLRKTWWDDVKEDEKVLVCFKIMHSLKRRRERGRRKRKKEMKDSTNKMANKKC